MQKPIDVTTQCQCGEVSAMDDPVYVRLFGTMAAHMALLDELKDYSVEDDYRGLEEVNILISVPRQHKERLFTLIERHGIGVGRPYRQAEPCES